MLDAREVGHLLFELVTVIRCRMPGRGRVLRERVECLLETYHQLLDLARRFIRLGSRGNLVEPRLRHGPAVRQALHDLAREPRIASARDAVGDHQIIRADLQAMIEQECSDLVQDMVARGKMLVLRVGTGTRRACLVSAMPRSEPAKPFAWRSRRCIDIRQICPQSGAPGIRPCLALLAAFPREARTHWRAGKCRAPNTVLPFSATAIYSFCRRISGK
ncbi:hypothetical protein LH128_12288 [Sphingomonas sp. LH128]|uniref:hypothetical protein n=1 Tax=Sphingomonadales TaxID=204457 RepID=UPI00027CAE3B|nr:MULTISPECIES: hypothetical protein [Sphingomonadaceae]EJU12735.1 hypothetical protein LH128_12288 [Sphingomonas sp. LH128]NYI24763.1 hypothetical protein [Sphingobium indicum]